MQIRTPAAPSGGNPVLDTTFVLFFLAVDFGQSLSAPGLDVLVSGIVLGMVAVLPYFFGWTEERPEFARWIFGRTTIALLAVILGIMFRAALGVVLPETFRFLPMTLLIVTAMLSCYLQFYAMIRFRLAR